MTSRSKLLVLGLGNDLLADDALGFKVIEYLRLDPPDQADLMECSQSGMSLIDLLTGYDRAIIIDCIITGLYEVGTVIEWSADDFDHVVAPSPHYSGLPELITAARELKLPFPDPIRVLAVEASDHTTLGRKMSNPVKLAVEKVARKARLILADWQAAPRNRVNVV